MKFLDLFAGIGGFRLGIEVVGNTKNPNGSGIGTGSVVYSSNGIVGTLCARDYKEPKQIALMNELKPFGVLQPNFNQSGVVYMKEGISPTLRAYQGGNLEPKILVENANGIKVRKLTPRECWRLQGFPDWSFDKAQEVNSNSQLYKQAGNSVTVNVISVIAERFTYA